MTSGLAARTRLLAALIAAPAVVATIGLGAIEAARAIAPGAPLFLPSTPTSLDDALIHGYAVEHVYAFIRRGHDPNKPIVVTHPLYTGGTRLEVPPLMLAVAARHGAAVAALLAAGASPGAPGSAKAACLARELGSEEIARALVQGSKGVPSCSARRPDAPTPLLAWLE